MEISDENALAKLYTLGTLVRESLDGRRHRLRPIVGEQCEYTVGQHSYNLTVAMVQGLVEQSALCVDYSDNYMAVCVD